MTEVIHTLDIRGLGCPLPVLKTGKAIAGMQAGEMLEITAGDAGTARDLDAFCRQTGNALLSREPLGDGFRLYIRKARAAGGPR